LIFEFLKLLLTKNYLEVFKMTNMKKQSGFTLIELIIVIIILGILAVTAAPKFLDISSDASKSALSGVKGAVEAGAQLARAKGRLDGKDKTIAYSPTTGETVSVDGSTIALHLGAMAPTSANVAGILEISAATGRADADAIITEDFLILQNNAIDSSSTSVRIYPADKMGGAFDVATITAGPSCYVEVTATAVTVTSTAC